MDLRYPILEPASSAEMVDAVLAAIEFSLASSIAIRDRSDIKSVKHWSEQLEPFAHQVENLITFCRRAPVALIADDVGMGKTISAGLIISELMVRKKVRRVLILAPKILLPQWCDELTTKFGIQAEYGTGELLSTLARSETPVVVTTYASARNRMKRLAESGFDMLILDEAHKVRNLYGTQQPPQIATVLRQAMAVGAFRFSLLLTATPIHNRLWDIYSLIDLLAAGRNHENPLGGVQAFANRYLADGKTIARRLVPSRIPEFRRIVGDYMVRTSRAESGLTFPDRVVSPRLCKPGEVERAMEDLVREHLPRLNRLQQISLAEALMSSPRALAQQLANAAAKGSVPREAVRIADDLAQESPLGCKAAHLVAIARQLQQERPKDWRMVVFTRRIATQGALGELLESMGAKVGYIGGKHAGSQDLSVREFQANPPTVNVIVSTDAGAEGVNLQAGNVVINYDLPWNPMVVEQRIGRVQRLASKHASVVVTNLVVQGSVEELVVARLMEKLQLISAAIGDIEGILEVADRDDSLEDDIKDLVLRALAGQDIETGTARILASIERAKQLYDESKALVAETLGVLRGMHSAGPAAPDLVEVEPRLSVEQLMRRYFGEKGPVEEQPSGRLLVAKTLGSTALITFDENDPLLREPVGPFGGKQVTLYAEGEPEFERVIGEMGRKRSHDVSQPPVDEDGVRSAVQAWISSELPSLKYDAHRRVNHTTRFIGRVAAHASCSVAVDRLERIVEVQSGDEGWIDGLQDGEVAISKSRSRSDGRLDQGSWPSAVEDAVEKAIEEDESIRAFKDFYLARLAEEQEKAGADTALREQVQRRFEPTVSAEVVAASGELRPVVGIEIDYHYPSGPSSTMRAVVDGATGELITCPELGVCAVSDATVPRIDLEDCAVSGQAALRHLMKVSAVSGVHMLPKYAVTCEVSGELLMPGEAVRSSFSDRAISPNHAETCAVTKRVAASDEVGVCAFTEARVHVDSLLTSEISGQRFRADEVTRSAISGVMGHTREFTKCEVSDALVLDSELSRSDASGKLVRTDWLVASEKNPDRFGAKTEVVRCEVSGKLLLTDEVGVSAVSGMTVDAGLLTTSELSGAFALPTEMFRCEVSQALVLPAETATCASTGKRVKRDLVGTSDVSGRTYLKRLLVQCPESGLHGLPEEMRTCEVTGLQVAPSALDVCTVTGKSVVRRLLVACAECGGWLLRTESGSTDDGKQAHRHHVVTSAFTGRKYLGSELAACAGSRLRVELGELQGRYARPLVDVVEAWRQRQPEDTTVLSLASEVMGKKSVRVTKAWSRPCPMQGLDAVLVEGPRRILLPPRKYAFFVDRARRRVVGEISSVDVHAGSPAFSPLS